MSEVAPMFAGKAEVSPDRTLLSKSFCCEFEHPDVGDSVKKIAH